MRVLEDRWLHKEIELLPHIESFMRTMHILVDRCQAKHLADEAECRSRLRSVAMILYDHYRKSLKQIRPGDAATIEEKCRYNLTITRIKREHERILASIEEKFDGWR